MGRCSIERKKTTNLVSFRIRVLIGFCVYLAKWFLLCSKTLAKKDLIKKLVISLVPAAYTVRLFTSANHVFCALIDYRFLCMWAVHFINIRTSIHFARNRHTHMLFIKPLIFMIVFACVCYSVALSIEYTMWFLFRLVASSFFLLFCLLFLILYSSEFFRFPLKKLVSLHITIWSYMQQKGLYTFILKTIKPEEIVYT